MVPCLYWHSGFLLRYYPHNDVSRICRCHWERWMVLRPASGPFHIVLSMNYASIILVAGRSRSEDRTSDERAKTESSFLLTRRLTARLVAATKIRETMRGRTSELGVVASM